MSASYWGWAKCGKDWKVVCTGDSLAEAMRFLLDWVRSRPKPPRASAVRPAGVRPDDQDGPGGPEPGLFMPPTGRGP